MLPSSYQNQYYRIRKASDPVQRQVAPPPFRRIRGYAFDPSLSLRLDTALINETIFRIQWEPELQPGPIGEYLEVVDFDPASDCWYEPVDLNANELLAQDGLSPSEGNPQFHQQMVYAVAMNTVGNFEHALGRPVYWAHRYFPDGPTGKRDQFVHRLRIYPHALRAANAYYSPEKKALLFGYFPGPWGMVFTCLSHDIVAHETTHAILDGMHRRYIEDNHEDTLAFHEAFADLVALFQHFTFPEVLRHQIGRTRGDLASQSFLGELARQFGEATGRYGALRSAIGELDASGQWRPIKPDPNKLASLREPHARGAILVAAVFGAFLSVYKSRVSDLFRIATAGTGVLPAGSIHPDLVERLASEAAKTAKHFLTMCIRALDYCPPVAITFGDYLRALVTADFDMVPNDRYGYRIALIESFRHWGIVSDGVRTHSEEHLRWPFVNLEREEESNIFEGAAEMLRQVVGESLYFKDREQGFERYRAAQIQLHEYLRDCLSEPIDEKRKEFERVTGLVISESSRLEGLRDDRSGMPRFEVHAIRPALRVTPEGSILKQVVITVTQRRRVLLDAGSPNGEQITFRGGSTLILDLDTMALRYAVTKRIDDEARLARVRAYRKSKMEDEQSLRSMYFGQPPFDEDGARDSQGFEPFSLLHEDE